MSLKSSLLALSLAVKTATTTNFNTANRVGTLFQSIVNALRENYDVTAYGAVGDGATPAATEAAGFAAAAAAAALVGGTVYVPKGTYGDGTGWTFELPSGVTLEGDGDASVLVNCYLTCTGTAGSELVFTAPAAKGATSISIPATGLSGSWLRLTSCINMQSTDAGRDQLGHEASADGFFAEFVQVLVGSAGSATLSGSTLWAYSNTPGGDSGSFTTSTARVMTFHEGARIRKLKMLGKNSAQNQSIQAKFCRDLIIEDVTIDANDITNQNIRFLYCLDSHVRKARLVGKRTSVPAGSTANPFVMLSSQSCTAENVSVYYGNQGVDIDCLPDDATYRGGPSVYCGIIDCQAFDCATDGFTSHWGCFGSYIENPTVKGSPRGVRLRDRGGSVRGGKLTNPAGTGIGVLVDNAAVIDSEVSDVKIVGYLQGVEWAHGAAGYETLETLMGGGSSSIHDNNIRDCADHGIYLSTAYTSAVLVGPRVYGNEIQNCASDAIQINSYNNGTYVGGNRITSIGSGLAGVKFSANIKRLHIDPNYLLAVHASGFGIEGAGTGSFMTDAVTFPSGEAAALLFVARQYTDAATPFQSIIRDVTAYDTAKVQGYGPFVAPLGTSGPTAERQTWGVFLQTSHLLANARDTSNNFTTHEMVLMVSATPEGSVTATVGKLAIDTTTGILYAKTSGSGNTGWVKVSAT